MVSDSSFNGRTNNTRSALKERRQMLIRTTTVGQWNHFWPHTAYCREKIFLKKCYYYMYQLPVIVHIQFKVLVLTYTDLEGLHKTSRGWIKWAGQGFSSGCLEEDILAGGICPALIRQIKIPSNVQLLKVQEPAFHGDQLLWGSSEETLVQVTFSTIPVRSRWVFLSLGKHK